MKDTDCPASGESGLNVKPIDRGGGGLVTEIVWWEVTVCCGEPLSTTVSVTVYGPANEYVCVVDALVPVEPSPKDQLNAYGGVPPLATPLNVTDWPVCGDDGMYVKLSMRVGLGFVTEMVCCDVAVCCDGLLSRTVRVIVYDPAEA